MTRTEFEVCTSRGAIVRIFDERRAANRYANDICHEFPGVCVFEVIHQEPIRRRIYRPATQLRIAS
jgi:hypothetical protein